MINSYKALSGRYLKDNKKRTILTIIGIILSVALITSICTFILTVQNSMLENTKKTIGAFHVAISNVSEDDVHKIEANPKINNVGIMVSGEITPFIKDKNIQLNYLNQASFKLLNVNLEEGELPKAKNEIVIERWILKYFDEEVKVGDIVKISDKNGEQMEYTLSGIAKDDWKTQKEGTSKAYLINNDIKLVDENTIALVEINDKADKQEVIKEISNLVDLNSKIEQNKDLLRLTGESSNTNMNESMFMIVFIVIGIVVLATIVVIYNAFHISIAERMKQFGLLRAIGTTKKQIMNLVIREASIMILIGIPLGLFFGIVAVYCIAFTFDKISGFGEFSNLKVIISPLALLLSGGVGAATIYVSAYLPARSTGKISPLVAISSQSLIKKEKRNRSGKFLGRFLRIDTAMALKNVKRNKRRFYVTVLSMAISVTLFVTFTSFAKFSDNFSEKVTEDNDIAFTMFDNRNTEKLDVIDSKLIEEVKNISGISEMYTNYNYIFTEGFVEDSTIPEEVRQWAAENDSEDSFNSKVDGKNKSKISVVFQAYEDKKLNVAKRYIKEGSIDNLKDGEVIIVRETTFFGEKRRLIAPMAKLKVGDEILISNVEYSDGQENFNSKELKKIKVAAIVDVQPFNDIDFQGVLNVIGTKETIKNIVEGNPQQMENFKATGISIKISDESYADKVDESLKKIENTNVGISYYNKIEDAKSDKAFKLKIAILLMGFTIVIALISAVNIVNTVTTNILLRNKEIAALKAVGMTRKQVKKMITFEGVLFGLYGGVTGSITGTILSYVLYNPMSNIRDFKFVLPWDSIIIAIVAVVIMGYVSALIPLRRLSKENIIDSIRGE